MDYAVLKTKVKKPDREPAAAPPPPPPPSKPYEGSIPFMDRGYAEDFDRMSRIPGMRDFQVTYSKTYRWNLMDSMEDYMYYNNNNNNNNNVQPMSNTGMQWLPPPPPPPPPLRRTLGPQLEYGSPGMILAPRHTGYYYPSVSPSPYGPYGGGGGGGFGSYHDYHHPDDCRVM